MNMATMPARKPAQNAARRLKWARSFASHVAQRMTAHTKTTAITYRLSGGFSVMLESVPSLAEGASMADFKLDHHLPHCHAHTTCPCRRGICLTAASAGSGVEWGVRRFATGWFRGGNIFGFR